MATHFLSEKQRQALNQFPSIIDEEELIQYFTLSNSDLGIIPSTSPAHTRLGFAVSLCALRFLGFIPDSLLSIPKPAGNFLVKQLCLDSGLELLVQYGTRAQTKSGHALRIENYLGFQFNWLLNRAMEHDRPTFLLKTATEKLKQDKIVRPTLINLEWLVGAARDKTRQKTYQLLSKTLPLTHSSSPPLSLEVKRLC